MKSGGVDQDTRRLVDDHLAGCEECRSTLSTATVAGAPRFAGAEAVAAVLFPEELGGVPRRWVYAVGALASSTLVLAVAVGYLLSRPVPAEATQKPHAMPDRTPEVAAIRATPPQPAERAPTAEAEVAEPPSAPAEAPESPASTEPPAGSTEPAAPAPPTSVPSSKPSGAVVRAASESQSDKPRQSAAQASSAPKPSETAAATPAPPPPPPKPAEPVEEDAPTKPKDEIDQLLFAATGTSAKAPPVKEEKTTEATGLTRQQVMEVMNSIQDQIHQCAVETGKTGSVNIRAEIIPSGRVRTVRITGMFAGTPAGDCVAKAVRGAVFPSFVGQPQPVNYPIPLR